MNYPKHHVQQGFSLIELLVALAINLVIVTAAAYLYLGTSQSRRELDQQQAIKDNGQYALDLIGRDVINAGFYPAVRSGGQTITGYSNPLTATAFNSGIYGCKSQNFNINGTGSAPYSCISHTNSSNTGDSLIVSYYTNDAMGKDIGHSADCAGGYPVSGTATATPASPAFLTNRYTLSSATLNINGNSISTFGLTCGGNINTTDQPSVVGIEELQFRYGVYSNGDTLQPDKFYRADEMAALGNVVIDSVSKDAWARVVAVEICLVARGLEPTKQTTSTGAVTPYTNCSGSSVTPTDRFIRRMYRKVYAVRNNLTISIPPSAT